MPAPYPKLDGSEPCQRVDPERFYPPHGDDTRIAKRVCQGCHVINQCAAWAIENFEAGVWGGTNDYDRADIRAGRGMSRTPGPQRPSRVLEVHQLREAGYSISETAALMGFTKGTVSKYRSMPA